jgi:hypothetical protein
VPSILTALQFIGCLQKRHFDHFLDEGQYIQIVVQEDQLSLILINHVGQLELALPI